MHLDADIVPEHCRALLPVLRAAVAEQPPAAAPARWEAVFEQAIRNDVAAFLYPIVRLWPAAVRPPEAVLALWRRNFLTAVATTARRADQAQELFAALVADGITAVPLKGIWLAERVYADPAQRPMCDIDLLVPLPQANRARQVLARLGYTTPEPHPSERFDYAQPYVCPRHALAVELHWQVGSEQTPDLPCPDLTGLWTRLEAENLFGVRLAVPAAEEQFALLVYHALHHGFAMPLRALLDLALLLRQRGAGWDPGRFAAVTAAWGVARAAPLSANLVADLFDDAPLPACARPAALPEKENRRQALIAMLAAAAYRFEFGEATLLDFSRRGALARVGLLLRRLFVPPAFLRRNYRCARVWIGLPIAYAQRAYDLARQRHTSLWRILRHDAAVSAALDQVAARTRLVAWLVSGPPDSAGGIRPGGTTPSAAEKKRSRAPRSG